MSISATYLPDLGRNRIAMASIPSDTDYVRVERSIDGINWTTVRGAETLAVDAGTAKIDDYEFVVGVLNTYRATYVDVATISQVGTGTSATANNAAVAPAIPTGTAAGDLMVIFASIRNSGTGTVNTPAGWTKLLDFGNTAVLGRYFQAGDVAPSVTFAGGVANADTIGQMCTWRNASLSLISSATVLNGSAQNIATPAFSLAANALGLVFGWKQDDWTSIAPITGYTMVAGPSSTAGDDAAQAYTFRLPTSTAFVSGVSSMAVTGGTTAISRAVALSIPQRAFISQETATTTPDIGSLYWLKNLGRPALNIQVEVTLCSEITRRSRTGKFDVLGRNNPVVVSDVQSSREFTIEIDVKGYAAVRDMDNRLATGEPLFLQSPFTEDYIPTTYIVTGDVSVRQDAKGSDSTTYVIPCTESAKPGSAVYGDTYVWSDVYGSYATWADVIAGVTTWSNLMDKVSNSIVIVP